MALILLDAGLVGLAISTPRGRKPEADREVLAFQEWYAGTSGAPHRFAIADVTRYEVQRELLRLEAGAKLRRLARLVQGTVPVESTGDVWDRASSLWADARREGWPTAAPDALDGDAILAASALVLGLTLDDLVVVATTNVKHLQRFGIIARAWRDIPDSE